MRPQYSFCSVVGARPQFIKVSPMERALRSAGMNHVTLHTGQHFDAAMSDVFFEQLGLAPPIANLAIHSLPRDEMVEQMAAALMAPIERSAPDIILVYGDTNSTLAGAIAGKRAGLPVAHVEAGLRSFNASMPEEVNRIAVDGMSDLLFCPTKAAADHLRSEGVNGAIVHSGDVMYDQVLYALGSARDGMQVLARLSLNPGAYAVATLHRAGATDDPRILQTMLDWLAAQAQNGPVVFPVHPRTRKIIAQAGLQADGLTLIDPLGYLEMTALVHHARAVFTDSGGLQKEAYFHRVPCVTLRDETEWVETIEAGWNRLWTVPDYRPKREIEDYGSGGASEIIVAELVRFLNDSSGVPAPSAG